MKHHRVAQGDSVAKLAAEHGLFPETLWNHPANADLKALRRDMNILSPGDVVVIPALRPREAECETDRRHVFRRRGVPMLFRVQLHDRGEPRREQPYELEVDGQYHTGRTDADGKIELYLPNGSRRGRLVVNGGDIDREVMFGHMDPITEVSGAQKRLANLGFDVGALDGTRHPRFAAALRGFQALVGLAPTGELDEPTRTALADCHDSPGKLEELTDRATRALGGE